MAAELVHSATNDKLTEMDWTKNIGICELVACDHRQAKDVVKAIKKRLESKKTNTQLYTVMLLEMLINNIGEPVHKQVVDSGILPMLVKIVKKKSDLPVREKIFLLLDAAQSSVCGASGKFPQYYSSFSELTSAGIQFLQRPHGISKPHLKSNGSSNNASAKEVTTLQRERSLQPPQALFHTPSESIILPILQKAGTALEVLRDVLNTIDTQCPEGANDEFTLDLVEQCSFEKQRVMHLAVTSLDEKVVSRAIKLNEQLERVLCKHGALLSYRSMSTSNHFNHEHDEEEEEEEAEQLFRRIRKGKACVRPQDEDDHEANKSMGLMSHGLPGNIIDRPLIRPLISEHRHESLYSPNIEPKEETRRPLSIVSKEANIVKPSGLIPPPPSKPIEREKFFQNRADGPGLHGHMRNLSLHSINTSSSHSGNTDFSD